MSRLGSVATFLCILSLVLGQEQFYESQNVGFDQQLSYGGSGSGSVPTVPSVPSVPTYDPTPSTPSYGGGSGEPGSGSVPSVPTYGGGSGGVPSVDPGSGSGGVPSVDPGSGSGGVPTVPSGGGFPTVPSSGGIPSVPSVGGTTPSGCSCDFWAAHVNSWPDPLQLISTVSAIFGGLASNAFPNTTLLTALRQQKTDPYSQLLRQGTAAMLNAYSRPHFQYTPQAVRTHFNAALTSAQAASVQAAKFANANRGYGTNTFCT